MTNENTTQPSIPAGILKARALRGWQMGINKNGNRELAVPMQLTGPDDKSYFQTKYFYFNGKGAKASISQLRIMGWKGKDIRELADGTSAGLDANDVSATVIHEMFEGKMHAKIAWINDLSGGVVTNAEPMNGTQFDEMQAEFADLLQAIGDDGREVRAGDLVTKSAEERFAPPGLAKSNAKPAATPGVTASGNKTPF